MKDIDPPQLLNLWKKGKTLYASLFEYTDESQLNNYNKSQLDFGNETNSNSENQSENGPSAAYGLEVFQKLATNLQESQSASYKLKSNLLNKILSEKLIGLGFEPPIKTTSTPQIIPIHIWPQKITDFDWNKSSFSLNGIEFLKIRLIKKTEFKKAIKIVNKKEEIKPPKLEVNDKLVGRPSRKKDIKDAYIFLRDKGKIYYSKAFKSHNEIIRETVRLLNPELENDKGLGNEAIRRTVKPLFDLEKENQKKTSKPTSKL